MWWVEIKGPNDDIDYLKRALPHRVDIEIVTHFARRCVTGARVGKAATAHEALLAGELVLRELSAAGRLSGRPRMDLQARATIDEHGKGFVFATAHTAFGFAAAANGTVTRADGTVAPRRRTIPELVLDLCPLDPYLRNAVAVLPTEPNAFDLYKVFEIMRSARYEPRKMGWVSKKEQSRFTASVNQERHAQSTEQIPEPPMTLRHAQSFIEEQMTRWIFALAEKHRVPIDDALEREPKDD